MVASEQDFIVALAHKCELYHIAAGTQVGGGLPCAAAK